MEAIYNEKRLLELLDRIEHGTYFCHVKPINECEDIKISSDDKNALTKLLLDAKDTESRFNACVKIASELMPQFGYNTVISSIVNTMKKHNVFDVDMMGVVREVFKKDTTAEKNLPKKREDEEVINVPIVTTSEEVDPEAEEKQQKSEQASVAPVQVTNTPPVQSQDQTVTSVHRDIAPSSIAAPMIKPVNLANQGGCGCGNPNCNGAHNTNAKRVRNEAPAPKTHQPKNDELNQLQIKVNDLKKIVTFTLSAGRQINTTTVNTLLGVLNGQTLRNELMARGLINNNNELHGLVEIMPPMQYYDPVHYPYSFMLQGVNGQMALIQMGGSPILNNGQYYDIYRVI